MARRRFLVEQVRDGRAEIHGSHAKHLARVLRTEPGRKYEISDGISVYVAEVASVAEDRVVLRVLESLEAAPAPVSLTLCAALIKFDRFEWLVEKATEVGVSVLVPVITARSEKGLASAAIKRAARWQRIAHESSQQARRARALEIGTPQTFEAVLGAPNQQRYFLDEGSGGLPLLGGLPAAGERRSTNAIALLSGPEGGWTDEERSTAMAAGWTRVSLGPLILRAETAAMIAAGLLMHVWWASQLE